MEDETKRGIDTSFYVMSFYADLFLLERSDCFLNLLVPTVLAGNWSNVCEARYLPFVFFEEVLFVGSKHLMESALFYLERSHILRRGGSRRRIRWA
jgi:hypothetical protein